MKAFYKYKHAMIFLCIFLIAGCAAQAPYLRMDSSLTKDICTFNSTQYVPLVRLCDVYGLTWKWDPFIRTATIEKNGKIVLRAGSDRILVNGSEKRLDRPVVFNESTVFVPVSFVRNGIGYIVEMPSYERGRIAERPPETLPSKKYMIKTVVVDPGHGGKDPGAIGRRLHIKERDLTLEISKRLKNILEEHGIKVIMTREDDTFIPLPRRTQIANQSGADLFVSIHINASRARSMNGFECYYLSEATDDNARAIEAFENSSLKLGEEAAVEHSNKLDKALWDMTLTENRRESAALASQVCASVESSFATRNRGTRTARFFVLKGTRMPAILVEVGYISNKYEEAKLKQASYIDKVTDAISKGILAYKDEYERTEGFTD